MSWGRSNRLDRENYWKEKQTSTEIEPHINVRLNAGDVICPKCGGTGKQRADLIAKFFEGPKCTKCWGAKKLDWIEAITGRKQEEEYMSSSSSSSVSSTQVSSTVTSQYNILKEVQDAMGKALAEQVDKDIMEMLKEAYGTKYKRQKGG